MYEEAATADFYSQIAAQLTEQGWCVTADFVTPELLKDLADEARAGWLQGDFRAAGIGQGDALQVRPEIRSDQVHWLDPDHCTPAQQAYLTQIEQLRQTLNQALYLGLFDFEGHLAVYPAGSYYRRHLDRFRDNSLRTVSTVLYLNQDWPSAAGGQLRLYTSAESDTELVDIQPAGGTLVTFLSDRFPHEVLPATRDRLSLTGWFRVRP